MAEAQTTSEDRGTKTEPVDSDGQTAAFCPSCKEAYWWMYGEDSMPTSLSCGHTLCFRCAKSQWCNPNSEDTSVFCITCSAQVGITTYKCPPSSQPEQNDAANSSSNPVQSQSAVSTCSVGDSGGPTQTTPTHPGPSTDLSRQQTSAGQPATSVGYNGDRVTSSAFSSPLVLDKIQSQDDAWRLLQHDEGFIRDWIVANVPDHVIFKMVGAGSADAVVSTNMDGNSFVYSSGNAVVISSPPKTGDTTMTALEAAGVTSSTSLPGMSAFLGENVTRPSFEQQFLHYLVNKATLDRPSNSAEDSGEHDLQAAPGAVDSVPQAGCEPPSEENQGLASASATSQTMAIPTEAVAQGMDQAPAAGGVGNRGDCGIHTGKESQQVSANGVVRMSADGEASQLTTRASANAETFLLLTERDREMQIETAQYSSATLGQSLSALQQQPTAASYNSDNACSSASLPTPSPNPHYQQSYTLSLPGLSHGNVARCPAAYPQRIRYSSTVGFAGAQGPMTASYNTYPNPYSQFYAMHEQYGPQYAIPQRYGPHLFQGHPRFVPTRGVRVGRGRVSNFSRPFRTPSGNPWFSKACSNSLNPSPAARFTTQPQIRFIQVLRTKPENRCQSEHSVRDMTQSATEEPPDTVHPESSAEGQEAAEAEVAVMKTRSMPHGTQVEDIYVVPQVWLSGGQTSFPPGSPVQGSCPACPYTCGAPCGEPRQVGLCTSVVHPEPKAMTHSLRLPETEHKPVDRFGCDLPSDVMPGFAGSEAGLLEGKQKFEDQELPEDAGPTLDALPDGVRVQKNSAGDDSSDYSDFQPVALLTTVPLSKRKVKVEHPSETATPETLDTTSPLLRPTLLSATSTAGSGTTVGWGGQSEETPVRDQAMMRADGFQGLNGALQIPSAPIKRTDADVLQKRSMGEFKCDPAMVKLSRCAATASATAAAPSLSATTVEYVGTCNTTVQHARLDSKPVRQALVAAQPGAAVADEVEIVETKSTLPSSILLPKWDSAEPPPGKKRLRRNLASEFYSSSFGDSEPLLGCSVGVGQRARGRRGRWSHSKYDPYSAAYDQQAGYSYASPFNYSSRSFLYNSRFPPNSSTLSYSCPPIVPAPFPQNTSVQGEFKLGFQQDADCIQRRQGTSYSLLHGARDVANTYPACQPICPVSPSYPDVLSHLSSGRGDYSNTPNMCMEQTLHYNYQQDSGSHYGLKSDLGYRSGRLLRPGSIGSVSRRLHFWPARGEGCDDSSGTQWKVGASGHRIRADELETVQWLLQEVKELNKQLNNDVLASLAGCLALLERNIYQDNNSTTPDAAPQGREIGDMDHLLRCILSLGQVVVQFGWWCRPHYWDENSERWGEMAMLASGVFEVSMQHLNEAVTFYLDHVCAAKSTGTDTETGNDLDQGGADTASANENELDGASERDMDAAVQLQHQDRMEDAHRVDLSHVVSAAAGQSECHTSAIDQTHTCAATYSQLQFHTASVDQDGQAVDSSEPCTASAVSLSEAPPPDLCQSEARTTAAGQSEASHNTEDQSATDAMSGSKSDLRRLSSDTRPSALIEYKVQGSATETCQSGNGNGSNTANDAATVQSSKVCALASSLGYYSYRKNSQSRSVNSTGAPAAGKLAVKQTVTPYLTRCTQTEDYAYMDVAMQTPGMSQSEVEVYYTVEGALVANLTCDSQAVSSSQTLYSSNERTGQQGTSMLYSVSHVAVSTPDKFTDSGAESSAASGAAVDSVTQISEDLAEDRAEGGAAELGTAGQTSHSSAEAQCETTSHYPQAEMMAELFEDDTLPINVTTESTNVVDDIDSTVENVETIFQNDQDEVNLFTVTVPADHSDGEVISDAAIMMSETVEIETDGIVEVDGMGGLDPNEIPLAEMSSSDHKESMDVDSCAGKRKRSKMPQLKSKHIKPDPDQGKDAEKGTASGKGGKRNLRSSRLSPGQPRQSPRGMSRKL